MKSGTERSGGFPWFAASVALHVVVLALLYRFTPLRQALAPERRATMKPDTVSRRRVHQVQGQLTERAEERLREKVSELAEIRREMERVEAAKNAAYKARADELAGDAVEAALADLERAMAFQQQALANQQRQLADYTATAAEVSRFLAQRAAFDPSNRPAGGGE